MTTYTPPTTTATADAARRPSTQRAGAARHRRTRPAVRQRAAMMTARGVLALAIVRASRADAAPGTRTEPTANPAAARARRRLIIRPAAALGTAALAAILGSGADPTARAAGRAGDPDETNCLPGAAILPFPQWACGDRRAPSVTVHTDGEAA